MQAFTRVPVPMLTNARTPCLNCLQILEEVGLAPQQLQLVCFGRPLPVDDGRKHFLVYPFLFQLVDPAAQVTLNWENVGYDWVPPRCVSCLRDGVQECTAVVLAGSAQVSRQRHQRLLRLPAHHQCVRWQVISIHAIEYISCCRCLVGVRLASSLT